MARFIVVASGKDGVEKAAIVTNLSVALGSLGKRTAVLNGDIVVV